MTETKILSWTELEMLVNDLKKKHTNKVLTDVETKILGSSGLGMVRYGGINRLNPYLARDLID